MEQKSVFEGKAAIKLDFSEIAKEIIQKVPLFYDRSQTWNKWNASECKWEVVDEIDILNSIDREFEIANITKNHIRTELLQALKMQARRAIPQELTEYQVQYKDTIVNILTGERTKATREYLSTNPIPHKLGTSKETPIIDGLIISWVGQNKLKFIKQWIAYQFLNTNTIARLVCLNGAGRNGKSTLIDLITLIVGKDNCTFGSFEELFLRNFGFSKIYRKSSCFIGEVPFFTIDKSDRFKAATSKDKLSIEFKNKTAFDYQNRCKFTMCTNSLPITQDTSDGFYRRWSIIDFPNQFEEKANVLNVVTQEEIENFCNQSIDLLKELIVEGKFDNEGTIDQRREKYEKTSNPLKTFIEEVMVDDPNQYIPRKYFNQLLNDWLKKHNYRAMSDTDISKEMKAQGYETKQRKFELDIGTTYIRCWLGLTTKVLYIDTPYKEIKN